MNNKQKIFLRIFWGSFIIVILFSIILFYLISKGHLGFMPTFEELENPPNTLATEVYTSDGKLLGTYFAENRVPVTYQEISPNLIAALIATEDSRFYDHSGIDGIGLVRVAIKTILLQKKSAGGGSTISQQLAKLLFPRKQFETTPEIVLRKLKEWIIAVKLEKSYTKEEIITMYLNKFDFLNLAVGVKSAAKIYFNTTPDELTIEQAATLVGMLQNPSKYNPVRRLEQTRERRNIVLLQMAKYEYITQQQLDTLVEKPLILDYKKADHKLGLASYLREYLRKSLTIKKPKRENYPSWQKQKYIEDQQEWEVNPFFGFTNKYSNSNGKNYDIYTDGLKIYTTIDSRMQQYAEESVKDYLGQTLQSQFFEEIKYNNNPPFSNDIDQEKVQQIIKSAILRTEKYRKLREKKIEYDSIYTLFQQPHKTKVFYWKKQPNGTIVAAEKDTIFSSIDSILYYKSYLQASLMSMDPITGEIKAYVGGPSYQHFMYDMVKLGKRQVGSTVKPFLYTLAMQEGFTPCDKAPNVPQTFDLGNGKTWTPKNSGGRNRDNQMVTLKWGLAKSNNNISAWLIKQFGAQAVINLLRKMGITSYLLPVPTICLGPFDISLYEMVGAYSIYANKGIYTKPTLITRIEDKYGNVIVENPYYQTEAIDEKTAYLMLNLMQGVINEGTGIRLRYAYNFTGEIAGKTGTTQNQSDGWFIGITQNLTTGIWVGAEDRSVHFNYIAQGQGANTALPIWAMYMKKVYQDSTLNIQPTTFNQPQNYDLNLDCEEQTKNYQYNNLRFDDDF